MIANKDIIIVGQQPWDTEIGSNCKNIAQEFSKHNRVLYVNSPLDRITAMRNRNDEPVKKRLRVIRGEETSLVQIQNNLWNFYPDCLVESINWIPFFNVFDLVNKWNGRKFVSSLNKVIKELDFENFLLFNDNEIIKCFYLQELLKPATSIYYSRDYILATDYWKKHGRKLEPLVIERADVCTANSTYLTDYCKQYNPRSYYVGQGCDFPELQEESLTVPADLQDKGHPIIGYVGALLSARLDIELLLFLSKQRPTWSIVLVGPEDEDFKNSALHACKNVFFLGSKFVDQLPAYINSFDVCINPQSVNELTVGNYPRKIDEYLWMGKPVVATKTQAMDIFKDCVFLTSTKDDIVPMIELAMTAVSVEDSKKRKSLAASHSWENSVEEIYQAIELVMAKDSAVTNSLSKMKSVPISETNRPGS